MIDHTDLEIFLVTAPGLETPLAEEARDCGFQKPKVSKGGVTIKGDWSTVWRANLMLRGPSKILVRIGSFHAVHLAQLDKRARRFPWDEFLTKDHPVRVEVSSAKSKIYHKKAAQERFERAITEELGAPIGGDEAISIKVRIFEDLCTISLDTSGEALHKRGSKQALNKAPMRETLASLLLRASGYEGKGPIIDPMCGSGTFVLEAAEMAMGLPAGRHRSFAFEKLVTFDPLAWQELKENAAPENKPLPFKLYGFDRDAGAIKKSQQNAKRADLDHVTDFSQQAISALTLPEGAETGLIIVNPPYGHRIGDVKDLLPLYQSLGHRLREQFKGWSVGLVTNSDRLAKATNLNFQTKRYAFSHGGIKVKLYQSTL